MLGFFICVSLLNKALRKHCICNFYEACNVCACNKISLNAVFLCSFAALVVNVFHDASELSVNIFKAPRMARTVLAHFKRRCCNTACVCCFCRSEKNAFLLEFRNCFRSGRHVGTFANSINTVFDKLLRSFTVKLVLGCTGKSNVAFNSPNSAAALMVTSPESPARCGGNLPAPYLCAHRS